MSSRHVRFTFGQSGERFWAGSLNCLLFLIKVSNPQEDGHPGAVSGGVLERHCQILMGLRGLKFSLCNSYGLKVLCGGECLGPFSAVAAVAAARGRIL